MEELTTIIKDATAGIDPSYFHLNIDGGDPIYRERVYCYELYHQMRLFWPVYTDYYLNGEIDKAAHPILKTLGANHSKPDLLVHKPGYMNGNHAIIEVKSPAANANGIRKDLVTLSLFKSKVGYQRAIYLIYGYEAASIGERVIRSAKDVQGLESIELWLHQNPSEQATHNKRIHADAGFHPRR
jgi:hypothetical protein